MDYIALADTVSDLFEDEGVLAYLHAQTLGAFDPLTGSSSGDYAVAQDLTVIYSSINAKWAARFTTQTEDSIAFVSPSSPEPKKNDLISNDNVEATAWTILSIIKIKPTDTTLLYICHLRKQ